MSNTITKGALVRQLWLVYFNRTLRDKGLITEQEYRKMGTTILSLPIPSP